MYNLHWLLILASVFVKPKLKKECENHLNFSWNLSTIFLESLILWSVLKSESYINFTYEGDKSLNFWNLFFLFYKITINILKHDSNNHSYNNDNMTTLTYYTIYYEIFWVFHMYYYKIVAHTL